MPRRLLPLAARFPAFAGARPLRFEVTGRSPVLPGKHFVSGGACAQVFIADGPCRFERFRTAYPFHRGRPNPGPLTQDSSVPNDSLRHRLLRMLRGSEAISRRRCRHAISRQIRCNRSTLPAQFLHYIAINRTPGGISGSTSKGREIVVIVLASQLLSGRKRARRGCRNDSQARYDRAGCRRTVGQ